VVDELWSHATDLATCRPTYVEARAGLARAARDGRIPASSIARSRSALEERWGELDVTELDETLALAAGDAADAYGLRTGDALQLASALGLAGPNVVLVSWDDKLRSAAAAAGLAVAP
jgi:uncharacterized protein